MPSMCFIIMLMRDAAGIAEGLRAGTPEVLAAWRRDRGGIDGDAAGRLVEEVARLLETFAEFLRSPEPLEGFSREG